MNAIFSLPSKHFQTTDDLIYQRGNSTLVSATMPTPTLTSEKCPWKCELTNDAGYVVYSALGSFYIPMLVMLFFYWRIYRAAIRTTRAINQGFRTTKGELRALTSMLLSINKNFSNSCPFCRDNARDLLLGVDEEFSEILKGLSWYF